jgi:membrane-associated protein
MIVANIITDLTDWLDEVSDHWWFLLIILVIAFLDSVVPVVPSETAVIMGGVAAGAGNQNLALVIVCGAIGAFLGDNFAYIIGRRFSPRINRRAEHRPKLAKRLDWARNQIRARGGPLLVTARFIPGGRTALTITSGLTHQPQRWFASWIGLAAVIWASYAGGLGFIFGNRFKDNHTAAFLLAFGAALSITIVIEVVRHIRSKGQPEPGADVVDEFKDEVVDQVKDGVTDSVAE